VKIPLTPHQIEQLAPYIDRVRAAASKGTPGMLLAQLKYNSHRRQWIMEPGFLDHDKAKPLVKAGRREVPA
jgi:hypothetical protein